MALFKEVFNMNVMLVYLNNEHHISVETLLNVCIGKNMTMFNTFYDVVVIFIVLCYRLHLQLTIFMEFFLCTPSKFNL